MPRARKPVNRRKTPPRVLVRFENHGSLGGGLFSPRKPINEKSSPGLIRTSRKLVNPRTGEKIGDVYLDRRTETHRYPEKSKSSRKRTRLMRTDF